MHNKFNSTTRISFVYSIILRQIRTSQIIANIQLPIVLLKKIFFNF